MVSPLFLVHFGRADTVDEVLLSQVLLYHHSENFVVNLLLLRREERTVNVGIVHQGLDGSSTYKVIHVVFEIMLICVELFHCGLCAFVLLYNARFLECFDDVLNDLP